MSIKKVEEHYKTMIGFSSEKQSTGKIGNGARKEILKIIIFFHPSSQIQYSIISGK